tara:strand:+ start:21932 stop:22345 length:414 start_codon:yes stop_codon:yes gene_type:complete
MDIENLKKTLIEDEGLELKLYQCTSGKNSIGVGRNLDDRGISHETAMQMLEEDIEIVQHEIKENINFFHTLPDIVQQAICNLVFNMGMPRYLQFKRHLVHLRNHDFDKAADELLDSKYASQLPNRSKRVADMIRGAK